MRRVLVGLLAVVSAANAATDLTPSELLARIRHRMAEAIKGLPNYTCRETIERSIRPARSEHFETQDLLRLEVAYLEGREMFAWPGSPRFGEKKVEELVPGGAMATGNFGSLAQAVFVSGAAVFTFESPGPDNPRNQVRFAYRMSREKSALVLNREGSTAVVAYHGFFTADPDTYDVSLFEVDADEIPWSLQIYEGQERMEYARTRIGNSDYLLPQTSEVTIFDLNGRVSRNRVRFDGCREFAGESTVTFTEPTSVPETAAAPTGPQPLPAGIEFQCRLTTPIERGTTAIGDLVSGEVTKEVRGAVEIPRGAVVSLRITGIESFDAGKVPLQVVSLQLLSVKTGGRQYDVSAGLLRNVKGPVRYSVSKEGTVSFRGPSLHIPPGLEMTWRTLNQK